MNEIHGASRGRLALVREGGAPRGAATRVKFLLLPLVSSFIMFISASALIALTTPAPASLVSGLIVGISSYSGLLVTSKFLAPHLASWWMYAGVGMALGAAIIVPLRFLGEATGGWIWLICLIAPLGLSILVLLSPPKLSMRYPSWPQVIPAVIIVLIGMVPLLAQARSTPLYPVNWFAFYGDVPFHEAMSRSIGLHGDLEPTYATGTRIYYHWLGDAWAGIVTQLGSLDPFVSITRVLPVWALVAGVFVAWGWGQRLSNTKWAGPGAALGLVGAGMIGSGINSTYSMISVDFSPTHTFALAFLLILVWLVTEYLSGPRTNSLLVIIFSFAFLVGMGRLPQGMVALLGIVIAATFSIRSTSGFKGWVPATAAVGIGLGVSLVFTTYGGEVRNSFSFGFNTSLSEAMGLAPMSGPLGSSLGMFSYFMAASAGLGGVAWLLFSGNRRARVSARIALGSFLSGMCLGFLLEQPGQSQVSFVWAALALTFTVGGAGVGSILSGGKRRPLAVAAIFGILLGVAALGATVISREIAFGGIARWITPFLVIIASALIALFCTRQGRNIVVKQRNWIALLAVSLLSASISTQTVASAVRLTMMPDTFTASSPLAYAPGHFEAAEWVRENVPREDLFAVSRQCGTLTGRPPECGSISFQMSALTGRRTLVEGYDYSVDSKDKEFREAIIQSWTPAHEPSDLNRDWLVAKGVQWIWLDKAPAASQGWREYGDVKYENDSVAIVSLS